MLLITTEMSDCNAEMGTSSIAPPAEPRRSLKVQMLHGVLHGRLHSLLKQATYQAQRAGEHHGSMPTTTSSSSSSSLARHAPGA